jgi:hypothetical protein
MFDSKFTCRHPDGSYFISCELELPIRTGENLVLGFISWAEVPEESYLSYLAYRDHIDEASGFEELMDAKLANEIHGVPGSDGTPIRFRVLPHDPIPYIRWAAEDSPLGARMEEGATPEYWHSVVQRW